MNPLKLKDNSRVPYDQAALCRDIQDHINTGRCVLVDLLEDLCREEDRPPQIFRYRNDKGKPDFSTGNYIGQFELHRDGGVERVMIGVRGIGFWDDKSRRDRQGRFLLNTMLDACWDLPLLFLEEEVEEEPAEHYDALLAARLAAQLDRAYRKGPLRVYRTFQRRDSRVQGRLDISREIRQGMGLQDGRIAYEVREYTEDNDDNRLFLHACREAERQYPSLMLHMRKRLPGYSAACQVLQSTSWGRLDTETLLARTGKKITNPIFRDYETLRGISRAFLRRQGYSVRGGGNGASFVTGVFLDLSELWERYLLKKVLPASAEGCYQKERYILDGHLRVRPDFLWEGRVVLDAKYRPAWGQTLKTPEGDWKYLHDDVYQVLTYMLELGCTHGGVLFPVDQSLLSGREAQEFRTPLNRNLGTFWRFPFGVPGEVSDYSTFRDAMDQEARRLARQVGALFEPLPDAAGA